MICKRLKKVEDDHEQTKHYCSSGYELNLTFIKAQSNLYDNLDHVKGSGSDWISLSMMFVLILGSTYVGWEYESDYSTLQGMREFRLTVVVQG